MFITMLLLAAVPELQLAMDARLEVTLEFIVLFTLHLLVSLRHVTESMTNKFTITADKHYEKSRWFDARLDKLRYVLTKLVS